MKARTSSQGRAGSGRLRSGPLSSESAGGFPRALWNRWRVGLLSLAIHVVLFAVAATVVLAPPDDPAGAGRVAEVEVETGDFEESTAEPLESAALPDVVLPPLPKDVFAPELPPEEPPVDTEFDASTDAGPDFRIEGPDLPATIRRVAPVVRPGRRDEQRPEEPPAPTPPPRPVPPRPVNEKSPPPPRSTRPPVLVDTRGGEVAYPSLARRRGYEGSVVVRLLVSRTGVVDKVEVVESSGYRVLDRAAAQAVKRWLFRPALDRGRPVPYPLRHKFRFRLTE